MNKAFKPLGLAVAVAAASAGVANAQPMVSSDDLGDLALVPYYTVMGNWITGIHIVNTSDATQVIKFRFRRAADSLDALDFGVVLSPRDVYAGFLDDPDGVVTFTADDTSCTVPLGTGPQAGLEMPDIYNAEGAGMTGYVEIIAMGQPEDEDEPIAIGAKHASGTPKDCEAVRSNFFANGDTATETKGVVDYMTSYQEGDEDEDLAGENNYVDSENALKVSYFIRDRDSGIEFGDNAVHIKDFLTQPSITNQEFGWLSGDLEGFDFPDLDGGTPLAVPQERNRFELIRAILGKDLIVNEWSANPANDIAMDWVITLPGQYVMMDTPEFVVALSDDDEECERGTCDYRDLPVTVGFVNWDREETAPTTPPPEDGELVTSPNIPDPEVEIEVDVLLKEVNVVTFGEGSSLLGVSDLPIDDPGVPQPYGWLTMGLNSADGVQAVCDWNVGAHTGGGPRLPDDELPGLMDNDCTPVVNAGIPVIGFAAWSKTPAAAPDSAYGRIIEHSYASSL